MVVPGHQPVLRDHHLARGVLRIAELIANHLEDEVEGLEREHVHHQAGIALRMHEEIAAPAQVIGKAPEAFGLALAQASEHGVELVDGLAGKDRMQELHRADDRGRVREVVGAGVAEDVADLRFLEQHRVDADAAHGVLERHHDRELATFMDDASHEVGAGALEEVGVDEFETAESAGADVEAVRVADDFRRHEPRVPSGIPVLHAKPEVLEDPPQAGLEVVPARIAPHGERFEPLLRRRLDELQHAVGADGAEGAAADGVEEGLHEAGVGHVLDPRPVVVAQPTPAFAPVVSGSEPAAQPKLNLQAPLVVELDPLADVLDLALPVALLEAPPRTLGEAPELPVVAFEPLVDEPRAARDVELPVGHRPPTSGRSWSGRTRSTTPGWRRPSAARSRRSRSCSRSLRPWRR